MSDKTIFWNVDTQYDFMREEYYDLETLEQHEGKLPVPGAEEIEANLSALTNHAYHNDIRVVNTADWHNAQTEEISYDQEEIANDSTKFPEHCMQGTPGAKYVPATSVHDEETYRIDWQDDSVDLGALKENRNTVLYKDALNVFTGNPHTEDVLDVLDPDEVVVYGVATEFCVDFAVNGLLERGYDVTVVGDATAGLAEEDELDAVMQDWQDRGADLTTARKVVLGEDHLFAGEGQEDRYLLFMNMMEHPQGAPTVDELRYANPGMDEETILRRLDELEHKYGVVERRTLDEPPVIDGEERSDTVYHVTEEAWEEHKEYIGGADPEGVIGIFRAIYDNMLKPDWIKELEAVPRWEDGEDDA